MIPDEILDLESYYADALSDRFVDECDMLERWPEDLVSRPDPRTLRDGAMDEIVAVHNRARLLVADEYRAIAEVLRNAAVDPSPWTGADPTLDPSWVDPRDRTATAVRRERADIAVRAAAADIAVRLRMSEPTVRARANDVEVLRERCPRVWTAFLGGMVAEANARAAASVAESLPADARDAWAEFDQRVAGSATRLPPAKFRLRARFVREQVHGESIQARHTRAAKDRGVWLNAEFDGMATLTALMPAAAAHATMGHLDAIASQLRHQDGETRTLAQLRADALSDLTGGGACTDGIGPAGGKPGKPVVSITIPAMTLLGADDAPAVLDGFGPIDLDTAKRLAGEATSWVRILTHPVTGTVLDLDRKTYRVPRALRRWLGVQHPACVFPGCNRAARECAMDHLVEWQYGGTTAATNLAPECEHHHRVKTESEWALERDAENEVLRWVSPSGEATEVDPPPW